MPELPEVETVRRGLANMLTQDVIVSVTVRQRKLRIPVPEHLESALAGAVVKRVERRAKYLLMYLDNARVLLVHLGMSGRLVVLPELPQHIEKHNHLWIEFASGHALLFHDPRRFGLVTLMEEGEVETHPLLSHLGPEPLSASFGGATLLKRLSGRKCVIKQAIMDQKLVVGVGNIYACEALFASKIHPKRQAASLSNPEAKRLATAIKAVLKAAIASGGSTLRDYVRASGEAGYFQHDFKVYGREGDACQHCERPIHRIVQAGRSTFFCESCQR